MVTGMSGLCAVGLNGEESKRILFETGAPPCDGKCAEVNEGIGVAKGLSVTGVSGFCAVRGWGDLKDGGGDDHNVSRAERGLFPSSTHIIKDF